MAKYASSGGGSASRPSSSGSSSPSFGASGSSNSNKGYRDDFDYAEAIANTQDEGLRQQLLAERQNKIDAEGLAGMVASNAAVSTWNGSYRPYSVDDSPSLKGPRVLDKSSNNLMSSLQQLYAEAEKARLARFEAARTRIRQHLTNNLAGIESDYQAGMQQTDINAQRSVLRNEEKLAALGLNMGARGAAATSGTAETSRIAIDNQYRNDLNALGQARLSARAAAQNAAAEQEAALESNYYTASESAAMQQAQMQLSQLNADRDYSLSIAGLTGFLNGTPTLGWHNFQLNQSSTQFAQNQQMIQLQSDAQARAYEQALNRWKNSGYVQQGDAAILGVPAGTPTADTSYKNASLALQKWKAGYGY